MIRTAARRYGDAPALSCEGRTLGFRAFDEETDRLGNALLALGLRPGDRVAVLLPNGIDCLVAYYCLAKAGLVRVPLNLRETQREHDYKLQYSGARALICTDEWTGLACEMVIGPERMRQLIHDASAAPCAVDRGMEDPLRLGFTGGTTGKPKAVTLTTRGEVAEVANFLIDLLPDVRAGDTMLHAAPIAHASGAFFLPHLLRGARSVIMPKFDAQQFLALSESERATATFIVPTMLAMILEQPGVEKARLAYRRLCYGAAPIAPSLLQRGLATFGPVFAQTYGQAESPMVITVLKPDEHDRLGSCGRPYTLVEARVVDDEDRDVHPGQPGEIVCRGMQLMSHYWERPEETAKALRGGWLHTGDIGYADDAGFFYIVDRKNDMLISGGYNVYPREVEDVLLSVEGVVEAAVVGLPDEKWGDRVFAVVSGRPGLDVERVLETCSAQLASYKIPKGIEVWGSLPKSAAGKILRREVRDRIVARGASGSTSGA
jgi:acyl-CoA synthetase (AMP-forming)/AMP-acid ligase II